MPTRRTPPASLLLAQPGRAAVSKSSGFAALMRHPGFTPLWAASGLSTFGTFISALAFQLLMIEGLKANQFEIGLVRSAQWLPSLLFGLIAGVIADRIYRKHLLIGGDLVSGALMLAIAVLALTGMLSIPLLAAFAFLLGCTAVLYGGAFQSLTADLLPPHLLTAGSVLQTQTYTAATTTGPMISGALVRLIGAPFAIAIDALSYLASALLILRLPPVEQERVAARTSIVSSLRDGFAWVYRHRTLGPYAVTLHAWFVGNNIAGVVYVYHGVSLGLDGVAIGTTLACAGVTGIIGASLAQPASKRLGLGIVVAGSDFLTGGAWLAVALVPAGGMAFAALCLAQLVYGIGLGIRDPLELSYRNAITPSRLRGRMNTTIRSFNWGLIAVAAPLGGWLALSFGDQAALLTGGAIMLASGAVLLLSPYRSAKMPPDGADAAKRPV